MNIFENLEEEKAFTEIYSLECCLDDEGMSPWSEIRNDYCDEIEGNVYIDAWSSEDDDEEGQVIAKINYKTKEIEYLDERAMIDEYAQEMIKEVLQNIDNGDYKNCE